MIELRFKKLFLSFGTRQGDAVDSSDSTPAGGDPLPGEAQRN